MPSAPFISCGLLSWNGTTLTGAYTNSCGNPGGASRQGFCDRCAAVLWDCDHLRRLVDHLITYIYPGDESVKINFQGGRRVCIFSIPCMDRSWMNQILQPALLGDGFMLLYPLLWSRTAACSGSYIKKDKATHTSWRYYRFLNNCTGFIEWLSNPWYESQENVMNCVKIIDMWRRLNFVFHFSKTQNFHVIFLQTPALTSLQHHLPLNISNTIAHINKYI